MASAFITRTELSDYLGRDVSSDDGATIAVDAACDIVRTVSGQTFTQTVGDTIALDGTGTDALPLPELPVTAAGTVAIGGTTNAGAISGGTTVTNYALNSENGILLRTAGAATANYSADQLPLKWPKGRQNIAVTYDHGYASADIPDDVRMVALAIASRLIVQGPASWESVGDAQIRYSVANTDLTTGERIVLAKYRRTR